MVRRAGPQVHPQWTIPAVHLVAGAGGESAVLLVTPAALATASGVGLSVSADVPTVDPDLVERVRNAVGWNGTVYSLGTDTDGTYALITRVLSVGSVLVLLFVAVLLVTALTLPALWRTTSLENLREE